MKNQVLLLLVAVLAHLSSPSSAYFCNVCGRGGTIGDNTTLIEITDINNNTRKVTCPAAQNFLNHGNLFPKTGPYCNSVVKTARIECKCTYTMAPSPMTTAAPSASAATPVTATSSPTMMVTTAATTMAPVNATMAVTNSSNATMMPMNTTAPSAAMMSGMPSDKPSSMPSVVMTPGPTAAVTMSPTGVSTMVSTGNMTTNGTMVPNGNASTTAPTPSSPSTSSCNGQCTTFSSVMDINKTISGMFSTGHVCVCPGNLSSSCPSTADVPTILIDNGQSITMECVAGSSSNETCVFGCPQVSIHVVSGGALTLVGNQAMEFTGGLVYSRMVIEADASVTINEVNFVNTACASSSGRRLRMLTELADGEGGAIETRGTAMIYNSTFNKCTALFDGGAIWAGNSSNTSIWDSNFINNAALGDGGAIYSEGTLYVANSTFSANEANTGNANVGGSAKVTGCGNTGISSISCSAGQGAATTSAAPVSVIFTSQGVAMLALISGFCVL